MTAVNQVIASRVINIFALVFIYLAFVLDWRMAALSAGGWMLLYISTRVGEVWSIETTKKAERIDADAADAKTLYTAD